MSGIGHVGLGFAVKKALPKIPLIVLLLLPMLLDILWMAFQIIGIDPMVWTHSFVMSLAWAALSGIIALAITRSFKSSVIIMLLVFSHWVIDLITHPMGAIYPNDTGIPIFFSEFPLIGAGLYNHIIWAILGEAILLIPGIVVYILSLKKTRTLKKMKKVSQESGVFNAK